MQGWSEALDKWQSRVNRDFLAPRGMAVKTQSRCSAVHGRNTYRDMEHWLVFAMNEREAEQLLGESHLLGNVEFWEHGLVMHPYSS